MDASTSVMDKAPGPPPTGAIQSNTLFPLKGWSKIPLELISYIIAFSLPVGMGAIRARMKALYSARMVSRMWRDVIDSTPSLWNIVSARLPLHVNSTTIQRSGRSPLDVSIQKHAFRFYPGWKSDCTAVLELAAREIGRWSTVKLWFPSPDLCSLHLTSPAPLLRTLHVSLGGRDIPSGPMALFGGIAPKLEVLVVDRLPVDWTSGIHGLRKLELKNMEEEQVSAEKVLDVLASSPLIERLGLYSSTLCHHLQSRHTRPTIIQLPGLKTIKFHRINTEATAAILSSIRAPNCTALQILDRSGGEMSAPSFPEPALSHFNDFQRLSLSANDTSSISFFDHRMEWGCQSRGPGCSEFQLEIPYDGPAVGVGFVTRVVGLGTQELVHKMQVGLDHGGLGDGDLAAYYTFGRCQSVTQLILLRDHVLNRPILELLGTWRESEDGIGRFPAFPGLEILVLASVEWTLDDLEVSISRRFGRRDDSINQKIPNLTIVLDAWWYCDYGVSSKLDLAQLQRLRTAKGVASLTRTINGHKPGMLAVVYEDDT